MKLETKAGILTNALRQLLPVIERRNTIPILGTVLFDGAAVTGTDLDVELSIALPASKAFGKVCIDHRTLLGLVRNIPGDGTAVIEASGTTATIAFSTGRYDLPALPASDWPRMDVGEVTPVAIDGEQFRSAIQFVAPCISTEETRYYLNGVCLDDGKVVATNGHRLGCALSGVAQVATRPIVPRKAVNVLASLPPATALTINEAGVKAQFTGPGYQLRTKLIDGTFPQWQRVVPAISDTATVIEVNRLAMIHAARRMVSIHPDRSRGGTIAWEGGKIAMAVERPGIGAAREMIGDGAPAGKSGTISFNLSYVISTLASFKSETVLVITDNSSSPTTFRDPASDTSYIVIMPLRVDNEKVAMDAVREMLAVASQTVRRAA